MSLDFKDQKIIAIIIAKQFQTNADEKYAVLDSVTFGLAEDTIHTYEVNLDTRPLVIAHVLIERLLEKGPQSFALFLMAWRHRLDLDSHDDNDMETIIQHTIQIAAEQDRSGERAEDIYLRLVHQLAAAAAAPIVPRIHRKKVRGSSVYTRYNQYRHAIIDQMQTLVEQWQLIALPNVAPLTLELHAVPLSLPALPSQTHQHVSIPMGNDIGKLFDRHPRLLLLGEAGAGKTALLIDLATTLVARARATPTYLAPLPLYLSLSTWESKHTSIQAWVKERLQHEYHFTAREAGEIVTHFFLILVLDGLNEVAPTSQAHCFDALNAYLKEEGFVHSVVISSNYQQYQQQEKSLLVQQAICIQPASDEQIAAFGKSGGDQLEGFTALLESDAALGELAHTPLWLNLIALTYRPLSASQPTGQRTLKQDIFARYIHDRLTAASNQKRQSGWRMMLPFRRVPYSSQQTKQWLAWLARYMQPCHQTRFYLEYIQAEMTFSPPFVRACNALINGLILGVIMGLYGGFGIHYSNMVLHSPDGGLQGILKVLFIGLEGGIAGGLYFGGIGGVIGWLLGLNDIHIRDQFHLSKRGFARGFMRWFGLGCALWIVSLLGVIGFSWLLSRLDSGPLYHFIVWLSGSSVIETNIPALLSLPNIAIVMAVGLIIGTLCGVGGGIYRGILKGFSASSLKNYTEPNAGILRTGHYSLVLTCICLIIGLVTGVSGWVIRGNIDWFIVWFALWSMIGLAAGYILGFGDYIRHWLVRFILWQEGAIPYRYAAFLAYAVERNLLRQIGNGFEFIHQELLEYFASAESSSLEE